jgi:hypothetical protein
MMPRRFARHIQLAQIGLAGQAKIAAAEVTVARGFAGFIEARYLAAAGVSSVGEGSHDCSDSRFDALDPAARDVALGAHAAVLALMKIVG